MSEATRQRWLHVHNRMEELNAKYGPLEEVPLPPWLDTSEGYLASTPEMLSAPERTPEQPAPPQEPPEIQAALRTPPPSPPTRPVKRRRRRGSDW